jgi:hypothetical protein
MRDVAHNGLIGLPEYNLLEAACAGKLRRENAS